MEQPMRMGPLGKVSKGKVSEWDGRDGEIDLLSYTLLRTRTYFISSKNKLSGYFSKFPLVIVDCRSRSSKMLKLPHILHAPLTDHYPENLKANVHGEDGHVEATLYFRETCLGLRG